MKIIEPKFEIIGGINCDEILKKIEKCGRICYNSLDKITDTSSQPFVKSLISRGHESVLEHAIFTVLVTTDRGVSHELVRHRIASYSQESTRFCNFTKDKFNNEITLIDIEGAIQLDTKMKNLSANTINLIINEWLVAMVEDEQHYNRMIELGATPQIARSVLPNSLKTCIVITMNCRSWRNFFKQRTALDAHPQMRQIAIPLLKFVQSEIPVIFDDIEVE